MKITHATYDAPNGQLTINRVENRITLSLNSPISFTYFSVTDFTSAVSPGLSDRLASAFLKIHGYVGTSSDIYELRAELARFC